MFKMNKNGMGMIEVMVAAAMAAMVSLGVATMMQNSMRESRRVQLLDTLKNRKVNFDNMLRDPDIWTATVSGNSGSVPFSQLISSNNSTSEIAFTSPVEFVLYNSDNTVAYDLLGPGDSSGNGFSERGASCTGFNNNPGSGSDNCPLSYRLLVGVECPVSSAAACTNPNLKLVARLMYNPASTGTMAAFTNFLNPVSTTSIADTVVDGKYDSVIKRTSTTINRSFRMVSGFTPHDFGSILTNCQSMGGGGGGRCHTGTGTIHERTSQTTIASGRWDDSTNGMDPYNLVTVGAAGSGTFSFNEPGYYGCTISVPAFATNSFTAYLRNTSTNVDVAQSTVTAGLYSQTVANIETKFNVTSTGHLYAIRESCETDGASPTNYSYCTLGIPTTTAYDSTFFSLVVVSCYKLDKSM